MFQTLLENIDMSEIAQLSVESDQNWVQNIWIVWKPKGVLMVNNKVAKKLIR